MDRRFLRPDKGNLHRSGICRNFRMQAMGWASYRALPISQMVCAEITGDGQLLASTHQQCWQKLLESLPVLVRIYVVSRISDREPAIYKLASEFDLVRNTAPSQAGKPALFAQPCKNWRGCTDALARGWMLKFRLANICWLHSTTESSPRVTVVSDFLQDQIRDGAGALTAGKTFIRHTGVDALTKARPHPPLQQGRV